MPRSRNVSRPSRAFFGASLASIASALLLLTGPPARSAGPGMWSPNSDWRGQQDDKFYAAHMILQPGDGTYHSRILWFRSERDQELKGGQWGWTPGGEGCSAYPSSNFAPITVPLSGLDLFCSAHTLIGSSIAVVGGHSPVTGNFGENKLRVLSAGSGENPGSWSAPDTMTYWRWYPSVVPLRSGKLVALAGQMHKSHRMYGGLRNGGVPSSPTSHLVQRFQPVPFGTWDPAIFPVTSTGPSPGKWPALRYAHTMLQMREGTPFFSDVMFGGRDTANATLNDTWRLFAHKNHLNSNPQLQWEELDVGSTKPDPRSDHSAIRTGLVNRPMVVFGGVDNQGTTLNDVWRLFRNTVNQFRWEQITPAGSAPPARYGQAAVYDSIQLTNGEVRRRMIVFGGSGSPEENPDDLRVWELRFDLANPTSATWYEMTVVDMGSPKPAPRFWHSMTADLTPRSSGSISGAHVALMFGGKRGSDAYSDSLWGLWIMRDGTVGWQLRASTGMAPGARARHSATFDPDQNGRLYVFGGETASGPADSCAYAIDTWHDSVWMRWRDRGFTLSGHSEVLDNGLEHARIPEVYDPQASGYKWTALSNSPLFDVSYPPAFMVPGAGNEKSRVILVSRDTSEIFYLDIPKTGTPDAWTKLPYGSLGFQPKTGVQYRPGEIMIAGGSSDGQVVGTTMTLNTSSLTNSWQSTGAMQPRSHHNLVLLPTGQVLAVGGNDQYEQVSAGPVFRPQLWTPNSSGSGGTWTSYDGSDALAEQGTMRGDHSVAILLPDARVLSAGGEAVDDQDEPAFSDRHLANLYCPPYLFESDGTTLADRPQPSGAPKRLHWGQKFNICINDAASVTKVAVLRPASTTHSVDMNQRFVRCLFETKTNPTRLEVTAPASPDSAPPGYYMLFVTGSSDGPDVPSIATWVEIADRETPAPTGTPAPDVLYLTAGTITCNEISSIHWSAPAPNDGYCTNACLDYDIRYSFSPITESNFANASPLYAPEPAPAGTSQSGPGVSGLQPCTDVYIGAKVRNLSGAWSSLTTAYFSTLCSQQICEGGGGGMGESVRRTRDETGNRRPTTQSETKGIRTPVGMNSLTGSSSRRLLGDFTPGEAPRWRLHYADITDGALLSTTARNLAFLESSGGSWAMRDSVLIPPGAVGVRSLAQAGRLVFPAGTTFETIELSPRSFTCEDVGHSEFGDLDPSDSSSASPEFAVEDTLEMTFQPTSSAGTGEDCFFVARIPGQSGGTRGRRPVSTPAPTPDPSQNHDLPTTFALHAARPNPFSRATTIRFDMPQVAELKLEIFDVQGRRIATLADGHRPAGRHSLAWDGRTDGGGRAEASVYVCRMTAGEFRAERRVTLVP